jgi:Fic family protein
MRETGKYETLGNITFFIPKPLPPHDPTLDLDTETMALYGDAMLHLGKLNEMAQRVPNVERFIRAYVNKEALLSSSIENVNTTLLDVFTQPLLDTIPDKNTQLVLNYTTALYETLAVIKKNNLPIVSRVILNAHKELMTDGEGDKTNPGQYRRQTVKVGNLVPPPPNKIQELMSELEKFINTDDSLPPLIKAGLAHVQFETIHPFLDGNGRIGRMLIVLMLVESGILSEPIIYPSYYFKKQHFDYYKFLNGVETKGDFESWIKFYLGVIKESSIDAFKRAHEIEELEQQIIRTITEDKTFGDATRETMRRAIPVIFNYPVISTTKLSSELDVSYNTAGKIIENLVTLEILVKQTQQKRGKLFRFKPYFTILEREYRLEK